ncbi:MAG: CotS family spore coat protein [Sarcina sp.]
MDLNKIKKIIEEMYEIKVEKLTKKKNVYRVESEKKTYCLKVIKYGLGHFKFIVSAIRHLQKNGFKDTPNLFDTIEGKIYIELENSYAYLTEWLDVREADYINMLDVSKTAILLSKLHSCSTGFTFDMECNPRIYWGQWIKNFKTRINEMEDFKFRMQRKMYKSEFDRIYNEFVDKEIERGKEAIKILVDSNYLKYMNDQSTKLTFCHHDLAHHNILVDSEYNLKIIDFDYCILDSYLHDLASLCMRVMRNGSWSIELFDMIIESYFDGKRELTKEELKFIVGFLKFPQDFWQVGLQYYWEQLPWSEERFLGRLNNYLVDVECRNQFIEKLYERSL